MRAFEFLKEDISQDMKNIKNIRLLNRVLDADTKALLTQIWNSQSVPIEKKEAYIDMLLRDNESSLNNMDRWGNPRDEEPVEEPDKRHGGDRWTGHSTVSGKRRADQRDLSVKPWPMPSELKGRAKYANKEWRHPFDPKHHDHNPFVPLASLVPKRPAVDIDRPMPKATKSTKDDLHVDYIERGAFDLPVDNKSWKQKGGAPNDGEYATGLDLDQIPNTDMHSHNKEFNTVKGEPLSSYDGPVSSADGHTKDTIHQDLDSLTADTPQYINDIESEYHSGATPSEIAKTLTQRYGLDLSSASKIIDNWANFNDQRSAKKNATAKQQRFMMRAQRRKKAKAAAEKGRGLL
jgi:hypothetical protein